MDEFGFHPICAKNYNAKIPSGSELLRGFNASEETREDSIALHVDNLLYSSRSLEPTDDDSWICPPVLHYHRLRPGEIRLLYLVDEEDAQDPCLLEATFSVHILDEVKGAYCALSYAWGNRYDTIPILLCNSYIHLPKNLVEGLQQVRKQGGNFWWIDAICINQQDTEERASQVQLMKSIFENALHVAAWLGPKEDGSDLAMAKLFTCANLFNQMCRDGSFWEAVRILPLENFNNFQIELDDFLGTDRDMTCVQDELVQPHIWAAIDKLVTRPWWYRMWILQEVTAGTTVNIHVGYQALRFDFLQDAMTLIRQLKTRKAFDFMLRVGGGALGRFERFRLLREERARPLPLLSLLEWTRPFEASDLRDKVFSMLSFASDDPAELVPDYSASIRTAYIKVALWHIERYKNLDFLGHCTHTHVGNPEFDRSRLPSWVPDWSDETSSRAFRKWLDPAHIQRTPAYIACGKFSNTFEPYEGTEFASSAVYSARSVLNIMQPLKDMASFPNTLWVSGLRLTTIHEVSSQNVHGYFLTDTEKSWAPNEPNKVYPLTGETLDQVFLQTLVADLRFVNPDKLGECARGSAMVWPEYESKEPRSEQALVEEDKRMGEMKDVTHYRRLIWTRPPEDSSSGLMGIGPYRAEPGDVIFLLKGSKMPCVLRSATAQEVRLALNYEEDGHLLTDWAPTTKLSVWQPTNRRGGTPRIRDWFVEGKMYKFVGECYIHGIMDGEVIAMLGGEVPPVLKDMACTFEPIGLI